MRTEYRRRQGRRAGFELRCDAGCRAAGVGSAEDGARKRRRLHQVLGYMSWTKVRTASFGSKLSLYINTCGAAAFAVSNDLVGPRAFMVVEDQIYMTFTFLKEDSLEQGVFVPQHQTLVCGIAVGCLEAVEVLFVGADGLLQLLDVLGPTLSESSLCLPIPLLPLLGCCVDLPQVRTARPISSSCFMAARRLLPSSPLAVVSLPPRQQRPRSPKKHWGFNE